MLSPGTKLDRYEIVRELAHGGMGTVYVARFAGKHGFEKKVALKTILPEYAREDRFREMFLDEARICMRLVHANVGQILDLGEADGLLFIVFEWVDGCALNTLFFSAEQRSALLDTAILLRVAADACAGLHAAHELRDDTGKRLDVVHRDVTPQNVLVDVTGFGKVIDFGIAKARDRAAPETRSGLVKGTPQYMAPEQASGAHVDRRADVWALGAVLYRGLSGEPPFPHHEALADYIGKRRVLAPLRASVHPAVRAVVERAMQRYAPDRFASAEELREALEAAIAASGKTASRAQIAEAVSAAGAGDRVAFARTSVAPTAHDSARSSREGGSASPKAETIVSKVAWNASETTLENAPDGEAPNAAKQPKQPKLGASAAIATDPARGNRRLAIAALALALAVVALAAALLLPAAR